MFSCWLIFNSSNPANARRTSRSRQQNTNRIEVASVPNGNCPLGKAQSENQSVQEFTTKLSKNIASAYRPKKSCIQIASGHAASQFEEKTSGTVSRSRGSNSMPSFPAVNGEDKEF
jgi:hypothetical protein